MVMVVIIACTNLVSDSSLTSLLKFLADGDRLLSSAVIELVVAAPSLDTSKGKALDNIKGL